MHTHYLTYTHQVGVIVMPADQKLCSHTYSRLCSNDWNTHYFSYLVEKFEPLQS